MSSHPFIIIIIITHRRSKPSLKPGLSRPGGEQKIVLEHYLKRRSWLHTGLFSFKTNFHPYTRTKSTIHENPSHVADIIETLEVRSSDDFTSSIHDLRVYVCHCNWNGQHVCRMHWTWLLLITHQIRYHDRFLIVQLKAKWTDWRLGHGWFRACTERKNVRMWMYVHWLVAKSTAKRELFEIN